MKSQSEQGTAFTSLSAAVDTDFKKEAPSGAAGDLHTMLCLSIT